MPARTPVPALPPRPHAEPPPTHAHPAPRPTRLSGPRRPWYPGGWRGLLTALVVAALPACGELPTGAAGEALAPPAEAVARAVPVPPHQVNLTFEKTVTDPAGIWEGRVGGDMEGDLRTELLGVRVAGPIWHVAFRWTIEADDPARSLVFHATGTLHTGTGRVVMNGEVVSGYLEGARVHEEGQAQDADGAAFLGTITILRRTP